MVPSMRTAIIAMRIFVLRVRVGIGRAEALFLSKERELLGQETVLRPADAAAGFGRAALVEGELDVAREEELLVPEVEEVDDEVRALGWPVAGQGEMTLPRKSQIL